MKKDRLSESHLIRKGEYGHRFSVMRLSRFYHSSRFASCSFDGTVRIWNGNEQEKVLFYFPEAIEGLEVTPDDKKIIVVLAHSSKVFIYDLVEEKIINVAEDRNLAVRNLFGTNPIGNKTALVTFDDNLFIYYHDTKKLSDQIYVENVSGDSLIWLTDELIAIPKRNGSLLIINSSQNQLKIEKEIPIHDGLITSIKMDDKYIVTVSEDGTGKILDLNLKPQFGFKIGFTPLSLDYSSKLGVIAICGDRNLLVVNTMTGELSNYNQELSGCNPMITSNSKIIRGTGENNISYFTFQGEKVGLIQGRHNTVESVLHLEKGKIIFASGDKKVHCLNYLSGEEEILAVHEETISSVIYIPSKNYIIAGGYDDTISIWNLASKSELKRITNVPLVTALSCSPLGDIFVAGCSGDYSLHIFSSEGENIVNWNAHEDLITTVGFLNDEVIVSCSDDKFVKFWGKNGKLISSIKTDSSIKSFEAALDYDYYITGHSNGNILVWEKITNRKVQTYNLGVPINRIKVINNKFSLCAAQERLYLIEMDGLNIISVNELCRHTEPIKGIFWDNKSENITTIDYSLEIIETPFNVKVIKIPSQLTTELIFEPKFKDEQTAEDHSNNYIKNDLQSSIDIAQTIKISEYLETMSSNLKELVFPLLKNLEIDAKDLEIAIDKIKRELKDRIEMAINSEITEGDPEFKSKSSDNNGWKSINWGKRK